MTAPGITPRLRKNGVTVYEAQVRRPKVAGRAVSPISRTFPTAEEALAWRTKTLREERAKRTRLAEPAPVVLHTLRTWVEAYLPTAHHLSEGTQRNSADRLRLHVLPNLGDYLLTDIRPSHLTRLYADLHTRRSHATTLRVHGVLSQVLKAAQAEGLMTVSPATAARIPRRTAPPRDITAWSPRQVQAFLEQPRVQRSELYPLIVLAFHTGLRRGELCALQPQDLVLTGPNPHLNVRRARTADGSTTPGKSIKARRRVPLSQHAVQAAREAADSRRPGAAPELLISPRTGRARSVNQVTKAFQTLVDAFCKSPAGTAAEAQRITLHGARHSFVTNHLAAGTPLVTVSKLAGHASVSFTADVYGHLLNDHADALPALYA